MKETSTSLLPSLTSERASLASVAHGLTIAAIIVAFLYFGSEAFEPLAIASLLSFIDQGALGPNDQSVNETPLAPS